MIPLRDDNPTATVPFVTVTIILLNFLVFGFQLSLLWRPEIQLETFVRTWGFTPARMIENPSLDSAATLFSAMFLHGSILHLLSNMLFLWVFGDNIEDELGHLNYLLFYLVAGLAGSFSQFLVHPTSTVPMIGASGAISGVIAAYLLLYPTARVLTAIILIIFVHLVYLPAWVLLGFWIFIQFVEATGSLAMPQAATNVAWFAHIGGFVTGGLVSFLLLMKQTYRQ